MEIRQPIVTVCGHVDHGKTSILDSIRKTKVYETEARGITQKISFTLFSKEQIIDRCPLILSNNINVEIPGFLFIDTPGHAAFSNLRKRGGALADLAVLVIDINEGIKPQTAEVIEILKMNKTPFVIALNKIDNISGWKKSHGNIVENINMQPIRVKQEFDEKTMILIGSLQNYGFEASLFYEIKDFTKQFALVPCSARTGEGINELIMTLCGLSQKFLKNRLKLGEEAKGVLLEIKKEKSMQYIEAILYDGVLKVDDEIAIASFDEPIIGKIRVLEQILPVSNKFKAADIAVATTGIRIQLKENLEILPGMPFQILNRNKTKVLQDLKKQVIEKIKTDKTGIIVKADSLGSLEALLVLLREAKIKVCKAGIGEIDKKDVISANANLKDDKCSEVILGFNVSHKEEINELPLNEIKIIEDKVVYKLIEEVKEYQEQKRKEIEKEKILNLASLCQLEILNQYVFHNSNPAIFGVKIIGGELKSNVNLIDENGEKVGCVKKVQLEKCSIVAAKKGMEVAISISGANFERQLNDKKNLYSDLSEWQFKEFKKNKELLTTDEINVLQKIAQLKRAKENTWGI